MEKIDVKTALKIWESLITGVVAREKSTCHPSPTMEPIFTPLPTRLMPGVPWPNEEKINKAAVICAR
jgi:hypothetical protein